jgi:hypothetical protein
MAGTLGDMKDRIARELRRSNIDTQIAEAISTTIQAYQAERWHFNESRDVTFNTVAQQEFYDEDDLAALGNIMKIDYVKVRLNDTTFSLLPDVPSEIESAATSNVSTGLPGWYVYYNRQLRLYPIPADAYLVRVAGVFRFAAPATDGETGNFWMTDGEALVRARAKYELALHVLYDATLAQNMGQATVEAQGQLKRMTNRMTQNYNGRVIPMSY